MVTVLTGTRSVSQPGRVKEIYHPDYVAKRMEIGAVLGAAPRRAVIRETSDPGDIIILLGGRTGRDGCGGATGSSKVHTEESIETCGAEVQKGNPPTERKIQRLFQTEKKSAVLLKSVMILVQAVSLWQSENWQTVCG